MSLPRLIIDPNGKPHIMKIQEALCIIQDMQGALTQHHLRYVNRDCKNMHINKKK